jgi:catechol 2,3-dioxygenase-like lactoylglutathione lyase family enzyme
MTAMLEHVNYTVKDPEATAAWMHDVFGWKTRWSGAGMETGRTVHVGTDTQYVALFTYGETLRDRDESYRTKGGLNHIAVTTDDLAAMEKRVRRAGFTPGEHHDYEPGRRFYFHDNDGIEYEVVQYD